MVSSMDTATLAAFAATYPTIFEEFMRGASEHVTLETDAIGFCWATPACGWTDYIPRWSDTPFSGWEC